MKSGAKFIIFRRKDGMASRRNSHSSHAVIKFSVERVAVSASSASCTSVQPLRSASRRPNVSIGCRFAEGPEEVPELVADLIRRRVHVICATTLTALAVQEGDARSSSFVPSSSGSEAVRTDAGTAPQAQIVAALVNPDHPNTKDHVRDLNAAAGTFGLQLLVLRAREVATSNRRSQRSCDEKVVHARHQPFPSRSDRLRLVDFAARNIIPTMPSRAISRINSGLLGCGSPEQCRPPYQVYPATSSR